MGKNLRKRQVPQKVEHFSDSISENENTKASENVKERNKRQMRRSEPSQFESIESDKLSSGSVDDDAYSSKNRNNKKKSPQNHPRKLTKFTGKSTSDDEESIPANDIENNTNEQNSGDSKGKKAKPLVEKSQEGGGANSLSKKGRKGKSEKDISAMKSSNKPSDYDVEFSDQESSAGAPDIQSLCETLEKESVQGKTTPTEESQSNPRIVIAIKSKPAVKKRKSDELDGENAKRSRKTDSAQEIKKPSRAKAVKKTDSAADEDVLSNKDNSSTPAKRSSGRNKSKKNYLSEAASSDETSESDSDKESEESPKKKSGQKNKFRYTCHKCNAVFFKTYDLCEHTCEGKRMKGFACEFCDKIFKARSVYINHKIIHSKKKPYKCGICGKKASSQSNHLYHVKKFHPESNPFPCEFAPCTKSFLSRKEQVAHHKMHSKFICVYCDEKFDKKSVLASHKQTEHDVFF